MNISHFELEIRLVLIFDNDIRGEFVNNSFKSCWIIVNGDEMLSGVLNKLNSVMNLLFVKFYFDC
jgi:hypothetical protein